MLRAIPVSKYVLDFSGDVTIPEFMNPLSLMVGAGDLIHDGVLNVEKFVGSDVFATVAAVSAKSRRCAPSTTATVALARERSILACKASTDAQAAIRLVPRDRRQKKGAP